MFPPDYNISLAERIIPAADLSEQISMADRTVRDYLDRIWHVDPVRVQN